MRLARQVSNCVAHDKIFPYGIIDWDRFHVKVGMQPSR